MKKLLSAFLVLILCISSFSGFTLVSAQEDEEQSYTISSSGFNASYPPENAFDGKINTFTSIGSGTKVGDYKVWLMADLGSPQIINSVSVRSRRDIDQENSRKQWVLEVANKSDFSDAVIIGEKPDPGERNSDLEVTLNSKIPYRYVRINSTWSYMVISEFEITSTPVAAGEGGAFEDLKGSSIEKNVNLLQYLGLVEGISVIEYGAHTLVSRGYAASLVAKLMKLDGAVAEDIYSDVPVTHKYASAITVLNRLGVLSDAENFNPDGDIRVVDFLKMIIYALGYSNDITTSDSYVSAVVRKSRDLELLDMVDYDNLEQPINKEQASQILYNALMANAVINEYTSNNTYLEDMFGIKFTEGILNGNAYTTLSSEKGLGENNVSVNNKNLVDNSGGLSGLLGKNVMCFYNEDDVVVCGWEEANTQITLRPEQIESIDAISDDKAIYLDDSDKERTLKLKNGIDVIRNGVCDLNWTNEDFRANTEAELTFIDNNEDEIYDIILLDAPQLIVLEYATGDTNYVKFTDYKGITTSKENIESLTINKNGATAKISKLSKNDIIYLYASKNSSVVRVEAYSNLVSGKIQEVNGDGIVIDGTLYEFSEYYLANKGAMQAIMAGANVSVALNSYNELVWVFDNLILEEKDFLAFIYQPLSFSDGIERDRLKVFSVSGEHLNLEFADKVVVDGKSYDTFNTVAAVTSAKSDSEYFNNKFAVLKVRDNYIVGVDTEHNYPTDEPASNLIDSGYNDDDDYRYYKNSAGMFANNDVMEIPLKSDTTLFTIPCDASGNAQVGSEYRRYYTVSTVSEGLVGSTKRSQYAHSLKFYNSDEFGYPEFGVCFKEYKIEGGGVIDTASAPSMLLNKVSKIASEYGEIQYNLTGLDLISGKEVSFNVSPSITLLYDSHKVQQDEETDLFNSTTRLLKQSADLSDYDVSFTELACGDIVRYQQVDNEIYVLERIFDGDDRSVTYTALTNGYYYATSTSNVDLPNASYKLFCGTIERVGTDAIILNLDGEDATRLFEISGKNILQRDRTEYKTYSSITKADISENQKAVVLTTSGTVRSVILY